MNKRENIQNKSSEERLFNNACEIINSQLNLKSINIFQFLSLYFQYKNHGNKLLNTLDRILTKVL